VLDQRKLPDLEDWLICNSPGDMCVYIKQLSVRGAPLIGVAAAMSLADYAFGNEVTKDHIKESAKELREARPTAVNLMYAMDMMIKDSDLSPESLKKKAYLMMKEEVDMYLAMARHGAQLVNVGDGILTHCNTGALATPGIGTALGVIREAHAQGKKIHVYVDETRPLLQGARLTAYELKKFGIPYTVICDNMAAVLMAQGKIQRVFLGADRIAINGDFANKIGTYTVAITAKYHNVPFHPVAPLSTVDFKCENGKSIPIEERAPKEVLGASGSFGTVRWAPENSPVYNPAFDVTPVELVESLILDTGVYTRAELQNGVLKRLHKGLPDV